MQEYLASVHNVKNETKKIPYCAQTHIWNIEDSYFL